MPMCRCSSCRDPDGALSECWWRERIAGSARNAAETPPAGGLAARGAPGGPAAENLVDPGREGRGDELAERVSAVIRDHGVFDGHGPPPRNGCRVPRSPKCAHPRSHPSSRRQRALSRNTRRTNRQKEPQSRHRSRPTGFETLDSSTHERRERQLVSVSARRCRVPQRTCSPALRARTSSSACPGCDPGCQRSLGAGQCLLRPRPCASQPYGEGRVM